MAAYGSAALLLPLSMALSTMLQCDSMTSVKLTDTESTQKLRNSLVLFLDEQFFLFNSHPLHVILKPNATLSIFIQSTRLSSNSYVNLPVAIENRIVT